jgi:site-specific recombinase XerD
VLAVKDGSCRLCWTQARYQANAAGGLPRGAVSVLESSLTLRHHQLFFDRMKLRRPKGPVRKYDRRGAPRKPPPAPACRPPAGWVQFRMFDARPDHTRFNEAKHADPGNPWLVWAVYLASRLGEARGWRRGICFAVRRGLTIVLSGHVEGDTVRYSEMFPALRALGISVERVADVLAEMRVLVDDRRPSFEDWLQRKLDGLAPGIRRDVESWLRTMCGGGPRSRARSIETVWNHMNHVRPALLDWSARRHHLREVTRDDVLAVLESLHGSRRSNVLVALRSLFAFCTRHGTIFRNPTRGITVGQRPYGILQPLQPRDVDQAVAAATTPASRLILALAAVHAARSGAIRAMRLDDVDIGNRRLVIAGRVRPLDDLTRHVLLAWLDQRRTRWPNTANPHLIINQQTATETGPVSTFWAKKALRGQAATLERLRMDRQLEEALAHGPDPLHLAAVFGLDPKTAIRYAETARQLLTTAAEQQAPSGSQRTQGSNQSMEVEDP